MSDTENEIQPEKKPEEKQRKHRSRRDRDSESSKRRHRRHRHKREEKTETNEKKEEPTTTLSPVDEYGILPAHTVRSSHHRSLSEEDHNQFSEDRACDLLEKIEDVPSSDSEDERVTEQLDSGTESQTEIAKRRAQESFILFDKRKPHEPGTPRFHTQKELYKTNPELKPKPPKETLPFQNESTLWDKLVEELSTVESIVKQPSFIERFRQYPTHKLQNFSDQTLAWLQGQNYKARDRRQFIYPVQSLLNTIHPLIFSSIPNDETEQVRIKLHCFHHIRLAFEKIIINNKRLLEDGSIPSKVYQTFKITLQQIKPFVLKIKISEDLSDEKQAFFGNWCAELDTQYETTIEMYDTLIENLKKIEKTRKKIP